MVDSCKIGNEGIEHLAKAQWKNLECLKILHRHNKNPFAVRLLGKAKSSLRRL
jgi:hypothetical protein